MTQPEFYFTITKESTAEFKDRGSRFLAYASPIESTDQFKTFLQQLKKEHPKAVHHCFAYRIGFDQNTFRVSDDGEPSGSAGRPILGQIDSRQLTNIAIGVVRYFGGTLLGVPGLINAYKTAASFALQTTPIVRKNIEIRYKIRFDYPLQNDVMRILKKYEVTVLQNPVCLFPEVTAGIPVGVEDQALRDLKMVHNVTIEKIV